MLSKAIPTPPPLRAPMPGMVARCSSCETQREFDVVGLRDIHARRHRFAVVYRCRVCKTREVRIYKNYIDKTGTAVKPPVVGLGWL